MLSGREEGGDEHRQFLSSEPSLQHWGFNRYFRPSFQQLVLQNLLSNLRASIRIQTISLAFLVFQNLLSNISATIITSDHLTKGVGTSEPSFWYKSFNRYSTSDHLSSISPGYFRTLSPERAFSRYFRPTFQYCGYFKAFSPKLGLK